MSIDAFISHNGYILCYIKVCLCQEGRGKHVPDKYMHYFKNKCTGAYELRRRSETLVRTCSGEMRRIWLRYADAVISHIYLTYYSRIKETIHGCK